MPHEVKPKEKKLSTHQIASRKAYSKRLTDNDLRRHTRLDTKRNFSEMKSKESSEEKPGMLVYRIFDYLSTVLVY